MKKIYTYALLSSIVFTILAGMVNQDTDTDEVIATINLRIQEDNQDNLWKVRGNNGRNMGSFNTNRSDKDRINWLARGSDMVFSFNKDVNDYFEFEEGLFEDGYTQRLASNERLRLTVRENAPADTLLYNVFVIDAQQFVVGNSPPRIVIMGR